MAVFQAACVQMRSGRTPAANIEVASELIRQAASDGAHYVQTPEMTSVLELSRSSLFKVINQEADDQAVAAFGKLAGELGIWLHIGSLAIRLDETTAANRAFVFAPDGSIAARYDKIHMFDVDLPGGESYRESRTYRSGDRAVVVETPFARFGLTICYDVRFAKLYRALAGAGAAVLTIPAAFTEQTGRTHWHVLQRARAIENGCFVVSAAQGGLHEDGRRTFGHSLIVSPWGDILAESEGNEPGIIAAEIDTAQVQIARGRIPSLANERDFAVPEPLVADRLGPTEQGDAA